MAKGTASPRRRPIGQGTLGVGERVGFALVGEVGLEVLAQVVGLGTDHRGTRAGILAHRQPTQQRHLSAVRQFRQRGGIPFRRLRAFGFRDDSGGQIAEQGLVAAKRVNEEIRRRFRIQVQGRSGRPLDGFSDATGSEIPARLPRVAPAAVHY